PTNRVSRVLDGFIRHLGQLSAWLWLAVLAVVIANVFSRFALNRGSIALEELSWHLFGAAMLLSLCYAVTMDSHVRVDVLRERFSIKLQAWIELVGITVLLLPVLYILITDLIPYAQRSFTFGERSQAPSGLPFRWILKGLMPMAFALIFVAAVSRALRCCALLFGLPRPIWPEPGPDTGGKPPADTSTT
ncbi:MAG: TRAP transporter small permease subunit, partial [Aquisalimonadaceae bacterium]